VNFLHDISQPGAAASERKEPLSDATLYEIGKTMRVVFNKAVVYQIDPVWRMLFITYAISGMRRGEGVALRWSDYHFEEGFIELTRSIPAFVDGKPHVKSTKTDENIRIITMPRWYMDEMEAFKVLWEKEKELVGDEWMGRSDDYVFHSGKGVPYVPESVTGAWAKIKKRYELKNIRLHDLRYTMITFLLNEGETLLNVQERAGHSSSKITTYVYGHVTKRVNKGTAEHFNKFDPRQFVNKWNLGRREDVQEDISTFPDQK